MYDDSSIDDAEFFKKIYRQINATKATYAIFDRMELLHDLFTMRHVADRITKSRQPREIFDLWERYKVLEKRTRI
jgi:hypothetical protein